MGTWKHRIKIKHLLTGDPKSLDEVQSVMDSVADILEKDRHFKGFMDLGKFRRIRHLDDLIGPQDYANKLLARLYDYADVNRIWIE